MLGASHSWQSAPLEESFASSSSRAPRASSTPEGLKHLCGVERREKGPAPRHLCREEGPEKRSGGHITRGSRQAHTMSKTPTTGAQEHRRPRAPLYCQQGPTTIPLQPPDAHHDRDAHQPGRNRRTGHTHLSTVEAMDAVHAHRRQAQPHHGAHAPLYGQAPAHPAAHARRPPPCPRRTPTTTGRPPRPARATNPESRRRPRGTTRRQPHQWPRAPLYGQWNEQSTGHAPGGR
jgi:hypothetical protein